MEVHRFGRKALCELHGRLLYEDLAGINAEIEELLVDGIQGLIISLDQVLFLDSSALGMLLSLSAKASAQGIRFCLMAPPENIRRMFNATRLNDILEILSEEEARAIMAEMAG